MKPYYLIDCSKNYSRLVIDVTESRAKAEKIYNKSLEQSTRLVYCSDYEKSVLKVRCN